MRAHVRNRDGFTLIEVIMAVTILSAVTLMMAAPASKFLSATSNSQRRILASAAADAQIALVRMSPVYDSLRVKFDSTRINVPFPGLTRVTSVVRTAAGTAGDITRVVVTISGSGLATPIKRTATIAAP
ncbi:MAG: prepilin-type N-terminal cleavage/methylation domain-containing protein [Gemmatimonadales bacterium]|nr:prepilin-type N-terminal cleavage/methylation domain-containing protein [Gemmatimonadales bacterium]